MRRTSSQQLHPLTDRTEDSRGTLHWEPSGTGGGLIKRSNRS
jgi:hypothetical protein